MGLDWFRDGFYYTILIILCKTFKSFKSFSVAHCLSIRLVNHSSQVRIPVGASCNCELYISFQVYLNSFDNVSYQTRTILDPKIYPNLVGVLCTFYQVEIIPKPFGNYLYSSKFGSQKVPNRDSRQNQTHFWNLVPGWSICIGRVFPIIIDS